MAEVARAPSARAATTRRLAVLLVPFFVVVALRWDWAPSTTSGDYAQYLSHARALVEGRPYGDIGYIYQPAAGLIGPQNQPPGLPVTLAPLVALGGVHSTLVRPLMVACVVLFVTLAAWRLARDVEPWQAALGGAFAALSIESSVGTGTALSDPGFAVLLWTTILVVDRDGAWTWRRVALVTALGYGAMLYRVVGIALIPGIALYALLHRRRLGALPVVPLLAWTAPGAIASAAGLLRIPFVDRLLPPNFDVAHHLSTFARQYRVALFDSELYPFASNGANDVYHLGASVLVFVGLAMLLWRARRTFMVTFTGAYGLLLLVAPVAEPRYAWPLYPVVGTGLALGATIVVRRLAGAWAPRALRLAAGAPLVGVLLVALLTNARAAPPPSFVRHADAQALFAWLIQRSRAGSPDASMRVAFHNPRVLTLETRVPAMGLVARTPPGQMAALSEARATHVVWQEHSYGQDGRPSPTPCVQRAANRLPDLYPEHFTLEYRNPTFRVYRVQPGSGSVTGPNDRISWSEC